jgi:hypothetical protein
MGAQECWQVRMSSIAPRVRVFGEKDRVVRWRLAFSMGGALLCRYVPIVALLLISMAAKSIEPAPSWAATDIGVSETIDGESGRATTRIETTANGDARISVDIAGGHTRDAGTLMLISGRWIVSRGLIIKHGAEIDFLDAAALNSQLISALLQAALPNGPPESGLTVDVSVSEKSRPITVATNSASGEYGTPWTVQGIVTAASRSVHYELTFAFTNGKNRRTVRLSGDVSNPTPPFVILDSMLLDGWTIHRIGPSTRQTPKGTTLDYGARAAKAGAMTVGELRELK